MSNPKIDDIAVELARYIPSGKSFTFIDLFPNNIWLEIGKEAGNNGSHYAKTFYDKVDKCFFSDIVIDNKPVVSRNGNHLIASYRKI